MVVTLNNDSSVTGNVNTAGCTGDSCTTNDDGGGVYGAVVTLNDSGTVNSNTPDDIFTNP